MSKSSKVESPRIVTFYIAKKPQRMQYPPDAKNPKGRTLLLNPGDRIEHEHIHETVLMRMERFGYIQKCQEVVDD